MNRREIIKLSALSSISVVPAVVMAPKTLPGAQLSPNMTSGLVFVRKEQHEDSPAAAVLLGTTYPHLTVVIPDDLLAYP